MLPIIVVVAAVGAPSMAPPEQTTLPQDRFDHCGRSSRIAAWFLAPAPDLARRNRRARLGTARPLTHLWTVLTPECSAARRRRPTFHSTRSGCRPARSDRCSIANAVLAPATRRSTCWCRPAWHLDGADTGRRSFGSCRRLPMAVYINWHGGASPAARHLAPIMPLLALLVAAPPARPRRRGSRPRRPPSSPRTPSRS